MKSTAGRIKSATLVALAALAECFPRTVYAAMQGQWYGYAAVITILILVVIILWSARRWHYQGIHTSGVSEVVATLIFVVTPLFAWLAGWPVWPQVLVSLLFLSQPVVIWIQTLRARF